MRVFWIKWDIWPSSEEAAGVGRLFQRRGELEKGVKGLFCTPLAKAPRRAVVRAMVIPRPLTAHSQWKIMGFFWAWRWALFRVAHWFVLIGTFILGPLGLSP